MTRAEEAERPLAQHPLCQCSNFITYWLSSIASLFAMKIKAFNEGAVGLGQVPCFSLKGFPRWVTGRESACQCRRHRRRRFDPKVGKIPGGGNSNPHQDSSVCLLGESPWTEDPGGQQSIGAQRVDTTEAT